MLYFQTTAVATILSSIPGLIMLKNFPDHILVFNIAFAIPSILFGYILMPLWSAQDYPWTVNQIKVAQSYSHLFAIKDKLFGSVMTWVPTGGAVGVATSRFNQARILCGAWTTFVVAFVYMMSAYRIHQGYNYINFLPGITLVTINLLTNLPFIINRK
jgi:hypothetical protein